MIISTQEEVADKKKLAKPSTCFDVWFTDLFLTFSAARQQIAASLWEI